MFWDYFKLHVSNSTFPHCFIIFFNLLLVLETTNKYMYCCTHILDSLLLPKCHYTEMKNTLHINICMHNDIRSKLSNVCSYL